jgi:predicted ester cyclase
MSFLSKVWFVTGSAVGLRRSIAEMRLLNLMAIVVTFSIPAIYTLAADTPLLLEPHSLIVDHSLPKEEANTQIITARRYDTFWNTGDETLARASLAPNFVDNTLPAGRPQGIAGPLAASRLMRLAIPDLRCEIEQMIVAGDRVVTHLRFRGHFTGRLGQIQGQARRSISSPPTFIASPMDASLRIGTSKTT